MRHGGTIYRGLTYRAEIHSIPARATEPWVRLHELGHTLGLDHHGSVLTDTVMLDGAHPTAEVAGITAYRPGNIIDLWGRYGVSKAYLGDIQGDWRNNLLFGGTGMADPTDNGEKLFGMQGADNIFGNGGNDTIYGGTGEVSPVDGNDTLNGGGGQDIMFGNGGNDVLYGQDGQVDTIAGGAGADVIYADRLDMILGLEAHDMIFWA